MNLHPFYNTQHSPVGAFASLTLGLPGANGGLGLELAGPAKENLWIGCESRDGKHWDALPFYTESAAPESQFGIAPESVAQRPLHAFSAEEIVRDLTPTRDTWIAGDLRFSIFTQAPRLPDPALEHSLELQLGLVPAVLCEFVVDNRRGSSHRRVFLGWQGSDPQGAMHCIDSQQISGIAQGAQKGIFGASQAWVAGQGLSFLDIMEAVAHHDAGRLRHGVGTVGALVAEVPPGGVSVLHVVVAFCHDGVVSTGKRCRYWYNQWWHSLEDVAVFALEHSSALVKSAKVAEERLHSSSLSRERRWMLAQAVHSYYGSTELLEDLDRPGEPLWVVNEGEYRMINTMDLVVDHFFWEMDHHPWTVRSVLDRYRQDYCSPDAFGLTFRHDMGVANSFALPQQSAYEQSGRKGCFSYMCHEELVNWILCAVGYGKKGNDIDWLHDNRAILNECMESLRARDDLDAKKAQGILQKNSDRCDHGFEITTYDSLDHSLGPAKGNVYLALKTWAAWLALEWHYRLWELEPERQVADQYARKCAQTIKASFSSQSGLFPAALDNSCKSAVIPAIEGLIFPWLLWGNEKLGLDSPYADLLQLLHQHISTALLARCRFVDGGWKLSESSENSWLSKIYLCQAIAEKVLGWQDPEAEQADRAHMSWLLDPENSFYAWSDQMLAGKVCGSRYYPRGVTAVLWLDLW